VYARAMVLAGIPVADRHVLELAGRLRDAGFESTADRLGTAQERQTRLLALTIDEREQILATLVDCPPSLGELRAVLLQEAGLARPRRPLTADLGGAATQRGESPRRRMPQRS
jgi:hypothetical protein